MKRRNLMALFCSSLLLSLGEPLGGLSAFAKDDDDDDDNSGSGSGSGHGGSGSSGHGNDDDDDDDNSGPGGGGHGGNNNNNNDDDDDDGASGGGRRSDQERARDGVEKGRILPLKDVLRLVDEDKYGAVIAVDLRRYDGDEVYRLRTRDRQGTIRNLRINARTGKFMNIFGF